MYIYIIVRTHVITTTHFYSPLSRNVHSASAKDLHSPMYLGGVNTPLCRWSFQLFLNHRLAIPFIVHHIYIYITAMRYSLQSNFSYMLRIKYNINLKYCIFQTYNETIKYILISLLPQPSILGPGSTQNSNNLVSIAINGNGNTNNAINQGTRTLLSRSNNNNRNTAINFEAGSSPNRGNPDRNGGNVSAPGSSGIPVVDGTGAGE